MRTTKQVWAKVFGDNYEYSHLERVMVIRSFNSPFGLVKKGSVFNIKSDFGKEVEFFQGTIPRFPKKFIEPFPFLSLKEGDKVKSLKTISLIGSCCNDLRTAFGYIKKGRKGIVAKIEDYGVFHRLVQVNYRGGAIGVYEDYQVKKIKTK